jgi:arylsulfatase A-like enzyme
MRVSTKAPALLLAALVAVSGSSTALAGQPNILLVTIDTLRADRLSSYGYERSTSPNIDALLARGARFTQARTPTPLTGPAFASVLTSLDPHEHGSTRNGIRVRPNLVAFTDYLERRGYATAAFVSNWTLKPELSGLDEYFEVYEALLTRKRWFGLVKSEATADDVSEAAIDWLDEYVREEDGRPFLLWVHFIEPHAPYQLHNEFLEQIGLKASGSLLSANKRYDSEVAFVDDRVGRLFEEAGRRIDLDSTLVVFMSDHGESLGEHGYWGHGRHLYEVTLNVPMGVVWPGEIEPRVIEEPASLLDVGPTILGLLGMPSPSHFQGFDWSRVFGGDVDAPAGRVTWHQAHKASVGPREDVERVRRRGLLEAGKVEAGRKEILKVASGRLRIFDLEADPGETGNLARPGARPSEDLTAWLGRLEEALELADGEPPPSLSDEDLEALKALGYIE